MTNQKFARSFANSDERRDFNHGHVDLVSLENGKIGKGVFEPGWRWSNDVKPVVETETCEASHAGVCLRGSMTIKMNSGEEFTIRAGDVFNIPPGHDAWVSGSENCEMIDVTGFGDYAIGKSEKASDKAKINKEAA